MRLRRDLAGAVEKSAAFRGLADEIHRFLKDTDLTTMMLKGEYGVGKTSAMRSIIDELSKQMGPLAKQTISFLSLAGLNEISDERALFLLGLDEVPEWANATVEAAKGIAEKAGALAAGVSKAIETLSLIGLTSKMSGALVVLDEVERRGVNLRMEDVFGAIIRLVENRGCKVVVIMNERQLDEKSTEALARYREKIFDIEYEFKPTPGEAIAAVTSREFKDLLLSVFESLGIANLRVISQAYRALMRFSESLKSASSEGRSRILENVCKIAALRLTTESRLEGRHLESGMGVQMQAHRGGELTPLQEKLEKLDFFPCEADQMILSYLETGLLDEKSLGDAVTKEASYSRERKLAHEQEYLNSKLLSGFSSFDTEEIAKAQRVLEECFSDCRQWAFVSAMIWTLERLGVEINRGQYEQRWAAESPLPEGGWAGEHATGFTDPGALAILEERFRKRMSDIGFDSWLMHIASGNVESHVLASEPWSNSDWLYSKLIELNWREAIKTLREIWKRCEIPALKADLSKFQQALDKALSMLASSSHISASRVEYIRTGKWLL